MRVAPSRKQQLFQVCGGGAVHGWDLEMGALRGVGLYSACNDKDERGNQLYRSGRCLPSVAKSGASAPSSFAVVLNFASLSDFFARMASRRAAARAFASDMTSVCFLKRGGTPSGSSE